MHPSAERNKARCKDIYPGNAGSGMDVGRSRVTKIRLEKRLGRHSFKKHITQI